MPEKSIRDMNALEQKHNSLSAKTFHAVLLITVILGLTAMVFGFSLYYTAIRSQYTNKAADLSKTISSLLDADEIGSYTDRVMGVFESLPEEKRANPESAEYNVRFGGIEDAKYRRIQLFLQKVLSSNGASSIYIGVADPEATHFVYVFGTNRFSTYRHPGYWTPIDSETKSAFEKLQTLSPLESMIPVIIDRSEAGEYMCTGTETLYGSDGSPIGNIVVKISVSEAARLGRRFLWQYCLILLAAALILDFFMVRHLKRKVVKPINDLAGAAAEYVADKRSGLGSDCHFDHLSIRTGDEIENLALVMTGMEQDLNDYIENLTAATAERERIGTELALATRIQADMLPSVYPAFPDRPEFDIYATMTPAKEVGGDFYDYYLIDEDHLGLVMADVSGKGVPAALFMMVSKILLKTAAMAGLSPREILERVNEQICANNREEMFVTVWMGILEISTGRITAASAGHEYPVLMQPGGRFELVRDRHGFVLGGMSGMKYREYELQLDPGAKLFVYTDGVPEATDAQGGLFGTERMLGALNHIPGGTPEEILRMVSRHVKAFSGEAPQFDDLTMLCLHYIGPASQKEANTVKELTVEAIVENIAPVTAFVDEQLEALNCPFKAKTQIDVAIDELFSNISYYAYRPDTGPATVRVEVQKDPMAVIITFIDHGVPYDPLANADPDVTLSAEERAEGGLGIFLVKKAMDDIRYEYRDGQNILTIVKHI